MGYNMGAKLRELASWQRKRYINKAGLDPTQPFIKISATKVAAFLKPWGLTQGKSTNGVLGMS